MTLTRYPLCQASNPSAGTSTSATRIFPPTFTDGSCAMMVSFCVRWPGYDWACENSAFSPPFDGLGKRRSGHRSHLRRRIGEAGGLRQRRVDVLAQRRVADRVAPVDQPLLQRVVDALQPRRRLRRAPWCARAGRAARRRACSSRCRCGCPSRRPCACPAWYESITWRLRRARTWLSTRLSTR